MGFNMDATVEAIADIFKTLSDANRLRILNALSLRCESVSAIVERTGLSQPLVSHHLGVLHESGLARAERRGNLTFY